jgi:hypothetical protein
MCDVLEPLKITVASVLKITTVKEHTVWKGAVIKDVVLISPPPKHPFHKRKFSKWDSYVLGGTRTSTRSSHRGRLCIASVGNVH